ncbi:MAG: PLP-dependent aminotransferase family protein [Chloroflexota bacterium]|nr:PLP-dependent aminotransferase family protein [Chloroflexota bacterium]
MLPGEFTIPLDRGSEEPIYRQLIRFIRSQVDSGVMSSGTRLPASRDLAHQLHISRISVVNAYAELRSEGYLSAHAGRGTFVAGERASAPITRDGYLNGSANSLRHANPIGDVPTTPDRTIREMMRLSRKPGVINFSTGAPPPEFFPVQHLRDAINTILDRDGARALTYEVAEGYAPLRASVRDYVSALGIRCRPEQVLITGGTQQAIDLVVQAVCCEGDMIITESPTYLGIIDIARTRRLNIQGVPLDADGIRLDMLENLVLENRPRLIYVMPSFQNPTSSNMSLHRRRQLLALANEYSVPVLEDGVYHEFRFEGDPLPPLKALDDDGIVLHVSGFTKNLLPGMRIGYVIANNHHYERLVRVKQAADISTPGLNQRAIHLLLERGVLAQQLERNNHELRRRRDVALDAAAHHLPQGSRWNEPLGGYYLWIELPHGGPTAAELYIAAIQAGVAYAIGSVFHPNNGGTYHLRLNYGAQKPADIVEGFRRLSHAWRELTRDYADIEKSPLL